MLDLMDHKVFTLTQNTVSHMRDCAECKTGIAHAHLYHQGEGITRVHVVSNSRRNLLHEVAVYDNGWVTCTCEHGAIQEARNEPARCKLHLPQAQKVIVALHVTYPRITAITAFDLWDGDLDAEPLPTPDVSGGVPIFALADVPVELTTASGAAVEPVDTRRRSFLFGLDILEITPKYLFVQSYPKANTNATVRLNNIGWRCDCNDSQPTPDTYCLHIKAVLKHLGK